MAKEEWGTKRTCPKCGERFYDLQKADPVTCIACGTEFVPEPILKTKQPIVIEEKEEEKKDDDAETIESVDGVEDIDVDDVDSGDDVLGDVSLDDDDDSDVSAIGDTKLAEGE